MYMDVDGFSLIELMIVLAIIATLASFSAPSFQHYLQKAKFIELVTSAKTIQTATEIGIQLGKIRRISDVSGGQSGIPENYYQTQNDKKYKYIKSIETQAGVIKVIATDELEQVSYQLKLKALSLPLSWETSGTCLEKSLCG